MLIIFQVLECLRGTSPTSSTTDSPRRDTPTDDIESESVFFYVCLFVFVSPYAHFESGKPLYSVCRPILLVRGIERKMERQLCEEYGTGISKPRRVPLLLALNLSFLCCPRFLLISPTNRISMSDLFVCFFVQRAHSQGSRKLRFHGRRLTGQLPRDPPMLAFFAVISSGKQITISFDN